MSRREEDVLFLRGRARLLHVAGVTCFILLMPLATACDYVDTPYTYVVFQNDYPPSATSPFVVYEAYWLNAFLEQPLPPGSSSPPQTAVATSGNTAYVVLAPGWNLDASVPRTSLLILKSRSDFAVDLDHTLDIPIDDTTFAGNCAVGSFLSQQEADFITQVVFPSAEQGAGWEAGPGEPDVPNLFAGLHYDAATCTLSPVADAGAE
jgi:hypothetical protein